MPQPLTVRSFQDAELDAAARLLAARHRAGRQRYAILPSRFEDADAVREMLEGVMGYSRGVAALRGETLAGFMFAIRVLPQPASTAARFAPERSTMIFAHGHAVSPDDDAYAVYHALYGARADEWVRAGIFDHVAHVPAGDEAAWHDLGFGRVTAVANRDVSPLDGHLPAGVIVRQAGAEDIEAVLKVVADGLQFHAGSPMFWPNLMEQTGAALRRDLLAALADEKQAVLLAREGASDIGVLWIRPGGGSPLFLPDNAAYIGDTAVMEGSRRAGTGRALVQSALAWARDHGYERVSLHFATSNVVSRSFWTGLGFVPVMYHLRRHIDERVAWAK